MSELIGPRFGAPLRDWEKPSDGSVAKRTAALQDAAADQQDVTGNARSIVGGSSELVGPRFGVPLRDWERTAPPAPAGSPTSAPQPARAQAIPSDNEPRQTVYSDSRTSIALSPADVRTGSQAPTAPQGRREPEGFFSRLSKEGTYLGAALERGWNNLRMAVNGLQMSEYGDLIESFNKAYTPEQIAADPKLREEKRLRESKFAELATENANLEKQNQAILQSSRSRPETQQMFGSGQDPRGWWDATKQIGAAIISDPGSVVDLALSSGPSTVASLATAVAVGAATRNPVAAASAGGLTSGYVEFGNEYAQNRQEGMPHDEAWKKAALKAGVVGALDAVSMRSAGKAMDAIIDASKNGATTAAVKQVGKETGRQAALGAGGEAGGSLAAGKDIDPTSVILEAVGETVTAPVEAVGTRGRLARAVSPEGQLAAAIDQGVNQTQFTQAGVDAQTRMALDPNLSQEQRRELADTSFQAMADSASVGREATTQSQPAVSPLAADQGGEPLRTEPVLDQGAPLPTTSGRQEPTFGEEASSAQGGANALGVTNARIEPTLNLGNLENQQAQQDQTAGQQLLTAVPGQDGNLSQGVAQPQAQPMSLSSQANAAGTVDQTELQRMLDEVDARNQQQSGTAVSQQQSQPETLTNALTSIGRDLGVNPGEQLNVTEVTSDKRLNAFAKALSQAFGVNVHWVDFGEQGMTVTNQQGETRNLGAFNGYRVGDTILVGANADLMDTTWHELTHVLETRYADVYKALRDAVVKAVDPQMQQRLFDSLNASRMREVGRPMTQQELESELVAYTVGQQATDPQLLNKLFDSFQDKTLAQQFKDILVDILNKLSAALRGPQYIKDRQRVIKARDAIVTAFKEYQQREAAKASMPPALAAAVARTGAAPATSVSQSAQPGTTGSGVGDTQPTQTAPASLGRFPMYSGYQMSAPTVTFSGAQPVAGTPTQAKRKEPPKPPREQLVTALVEGRNIPATVLLAEEDIFRVYQNTKALLARAPVIKARYDTRMLRVADREGMTLQAGPIKKFPRAFGKIWFDYAGDHTKIGDVVRSTLVVADWNELNNMIDAVTSFFPGVSVKRNGWDPAAPVHPSGYRDVFFKGAQIGGFPVELQMNFAPMLKAKDVAHKLYEQAEGLRRAMISREKPMSPGDLSAAQDQINELERDQFEIYSEAAEVVFDRANAARQSASDMGTPSEVQVDRPNVRGAVSPVAGLSVQAESPPLGARVTGTPLTSKNVVPAGNEAGIDATLSSPKAIPDGSIPQQTDIVQAQRRVATEPENPLKGTVDAKEAEGRIARRLKRKDGVGAPVNTRVEFGAGKQKLVLGKITVQDWLDRVQLLMEPAEMQDARSWYRQLDEALRPIFGGSTPQYALAWLMSQKRASPTKGMTDVLRASDMAAGKAEIKKAGLNQDALIDILSGRMPEGGIGAKLMDFLDSELGRSTRTIVNDDPRGRQPAAIDVWATRDIGFIDETVFEFLRKRFGDDAVQQLLPDKTTNGESQYEYGIDFYNDVVDFLNSRNFDGGGWTAREVQAVGWVTMQRAMGIQAEFVRDIIGGNTRRISIGLAPGADSVLAGKLAGKEIPVETAQREISYLADLAGIRVRQNVAGVGAYLQWIEGAVQIDALASPEAVQDFMDMVGYAFQQTEVISTRPLASGKNMAIDVMSPDLKTVDQATAFFAKFLETAPKDKKGEILAPGFQQIVIDGTPGIRLLNFAGNWRQTQVQQILDAINTAQDSLGVELTDINTKQVVLESTKNDWKESPDGKVYLDSLRNRGRLQEVEQLQRRYAPSRVDVAGDGTVSWEPAAASRVVRLDQPPIRSSAGSGRVLGEAQPGASSFVGVHYGNARTETLVGSRYGSGIKGAEARRLADSNDPRIKRRVYFYIEDDMGRMPRAESGLGQYVYSQQFDNILGPGADMSRLYRASNQDFNAFESSIVDAGYDGYAVPNMGMMVVLNNDVPVDYEGTRVEIAQRAESGAVQLSEAGQFSRRDVQLASEGDPRAPRLFGISKTPAVLKAVGAPDQLLVMEPPAVMKVTNPGMFGKNEQDAVRRNAVGMIVPVKARIALTVDELRDVPRQIADPVAVIRSEGDRAGRRYGYKVLLDLVKDGNPVVAIVHPDVKYDPDRATQLASVYPMNEDRTLSETNSELTKQGQLLYFNKGKAMALASKIGGKLPALTRTTAVGSKAPGQVPNRQFQPLSNSNFARQIALQGNRFGLAERSAVERTSNLLANEFSRVTDVQRQVVAQGGVMQEDTNLENALHRMYGRAGSRIDDFRKNTLKPIINDAAKQGVNLNDVAMYMYANHAEERNAHIRSINPQLASDGSGMSDADAKAIIASLQAKGAQFAKIKSIADRLQAITRLTGQTLLGGGLIDVATSQAWATGWKYYVPLKGFERIDDDGKLTATRPFDPRKPFFKRAMGRESRAGQIIENIISDYEQAIVAAERNKVRQAALKFVLQNPDPALWQVDPMVLQKRWDKTQGIVQYAMVQDTGDRTVGVRVNGVPRSIRFNDPAMLQDLLMKPIGEDGQKWVKYGGALNRTLAKLWTALSPAFAVFNFMRDSVAGGLKTFGTRGVGATVDYVRDILPAGYAVMRAERNNSWGQNSVLKAYYDMYRVDGGKTGFLDLMGIEDRQRRLESEFKNAMASVDNPASYHRLMLRYVQNAEDLIMDVNSGIENAGRVAAYKSFIERSGYNHTNAPQEVREQAAIFAKDLTVNFNRKGKWTPLIAPVFLFWNPAVQGALNTAKFAMTRGGAPIVASLVGLGYIVATISSVAAGDDDDKYWDKEANRNAKIKNLLFFDSEGNTVSITLPYGFGFFVNLGYAIKDLERGRNPKKVASFMRDSLFTHFSPLGSMDNVMTFLSPTILDPISVVTSGERESGSPLFPRANDKAVPTSEKYWSDTRGTILQRFTTWVNEVSGGSQGKAGDVSISPEQLSYLISYVTGGAGTFVKDLVTTIDLALNVGPEAPIEKNKIPIFRQLYQTNTGRGDSMSFNVNAIRVKEADQELDLLDLPNSREKSPNAWARRSANEKFDELRKAHQNVVKQLSLLRKEEIDVRDNANLTQAEQYDRLKRIDQERRKIEVEFNRDFYRAQRRAGEPR